MALGYGEGTGGGLTGASRAAGGGYGGMRGAAGKGFQSSHLTGDSHLTDFNNQGYSTIKPSPTLSTMNQRGNDIAGGPSAGGGGLGYSKQTEDEMIGKAADEISSGQEEAKRAAQERAAALGFASSGGTEEAMRRIDSDAAGAKADAARDVRIESARLGFEREQRNADRALEAQKLAASQANETNPMDEFWKNYHNPVATGGGASGGGGGGRGGKGNRANIQIIGGGAGRAAPAAGGGAGAAAGGAAAGGGGGRLAQAAGSGNSRNSTF